MSGYWREHRALMRPGTADDHDLRVREAHEAVRDRWIAERRHAALARAILAEWTSGDCVAHMAPLTRALLDEGAFELHAHLWRRVIRRQCDGFFHWLGAVDPARPQAFLRLLNQSVDAGAPGASAYPARDEHIAPFLLQRLVADLGHWRSELQSAGRPTDEPDRIERALQALRRPVIRPGRFPAPARPID